jgi:hypothetical protein
MLNNFYEVKRMEHLNLKNGLLIFDCENGSYRFQPHDRHIFSKIQVDYKYDKEQDCSLWKQTLKQYFGSLNCPQGS